MNRDVPAEAAEMSALEAARRLEVDLNRLYILLRLGRVAARKVNGRWQVSSSAVEQRIRDRAATAEARAKEQLVGQQSLLAFGPVAGAGRASRVREARGNQSVFCAKRLTRLTPRDRGGTRQ